LSAAVAIVGIIACLNVTGLLLARNAGRAHEIATRRALGAARGRLVRQMSAEALTLAALGGAASIPLSVWGAQLMAATFDGFLAEASPDLATTAIVAIAAGAAMGVLPALQLLRGRALRVDMRAGRLADASSSLQSVLIAAQLALTVAVVVATGVLVRSYIAVERVDPGFTSERVLTMFASSGGLGPDFYPRAVERVRAVPGVEYVGASNTLMFLPPGGSATLRRIDGKPPEPPDRWRPLWSLRTGGDYFQALGTPLVECRWFADADRMGAPPVAIINETMARRFWPNESAIGKRFKDTTPQGPNDDWITVVGVVRDTRNFGLEREPVAQWFQPQLQSGRATTLMFIRTRTAPESVVAAIRAALHDLDKDVRIARISTLERLIAAQTAPRRVQSSIMLAFSSFALMLAGLGIYGLVQLAVARRTSEIGLRVALGANVRAVVSLVAGHAVRLAAVGIAGGLVAALAVVRLIAGQLFGVSPVDPVTFTVVPILIFLLTLAACVVPLRRALSVDAVTALRAE